MLAKLVGEAMLQREARTWTATNSCVDPIMFLLPVYVNRKRRLIKNNAGEQRLNVEKQKKALFKEKALI